jgi:DNA polymerase-3 subunit gamma/tau
MAYTVLARRYRSQSFDDLIGQEPIARTLQNAIASDRLAHAYLFTGTRGVGKTSAARIFAKALNGNKSKEVEAAIMTGRDTDVVEIDAASNTGVDSARELIANAAYRPLRGPYKIYIIDEVHMLSTQAFNALLKTMEEPPEHVKFILCTTDAHKVPPTIQSRCQRYDFRNIPIDQIVKHLTVVLKQEKYSAEPELLYTVATLANGSMRDALSLLDRLLAAGEKNLTLKLLQDLLGLPDRQLMADFLSAVADGHPKHALEAMDTLLSKGTSIDQVLETLLDRLRDLLVLSACGSDSPAVQLSEDSRAAEVKLAARFDGSSLIYNIALVESTQRSAKNSAAPRALLDAMVARMAMSEKLADVTALVRELSGGKPAPTSSKAPATTSASPKVGTTAKKS